MCWPEQFSHCRCVLALIFHMISLKLFFLKTSVNAPGAASPSTLIFMCGALGYLPI